MDHFLPMNRFSLCTKRKFPRHSSGESFPSLHTQFVQMVRKKYNIHGWSNSAYLGLVFRKGRQDRIGFPGLNHQWENRLMLSQHFTLRMNSIRAFTQKTHSWIRPSWLRQNDPQNKLSTWINSRALFTSPDPLIWGCQIGRQERGIRNAISRHGEIFHRSLKSPSKQSLSFRERIEKTITWRMILLKKKTELQVVNSATKCSAIQEQFLKQAWKYMSLLGREKVNQQRGKRSSFISRQGVFREILAEPILFQGMFARPIIIQKMLDCFLKKRSNLRPWRHRGDVWGNLWEEMWKKWHVTFTEILKQKYSPFQRRSAIRNAFSLQGIDVSFRQVGLEIHTNQIFKELIAQTFQRTTADWVQARGKGKFLGYPLQNHEDFLQTLRLGPILIPFSNDMKKIIATGNSRIKGFGKTGFSPILLAQNSLRGRQQEGANLISQFGPPLELKVAKGSSKLPEETVQAVNTLTKNLLKLESLPEKKAFTLDVGQLTNEVYDQIQRRIQIERERRGL